MPDYCTCGAQLPPDARFCHKCGRPLFDEPHLTEEAETSNEPILVEVPLRKLQPPAALPLNFHNPIAVRVGFSMASLAALLCWLPLLNLGGIVWLFAAGFLSVFLYHRRTGQLLNIRAGARLGWITGVFSFAIITVLFTISMIAIIHSSGGLAAVYQEQLKSMSIQDPNMEQAVKLFQSPSGMATVIIFTLILFFTIIISLCTAGGALGAKIVGKD